MHGLLYVFLVPAWQHYDEPGHFEYAWLIANNGHLPRAGDYNEGMRREVGASMTEHAFYRESGWKPDILAPGESINIGISQLRHPPVYYALVALPLSVLRYSDVDLQLIAGRFVSLLLYLITLLASWAIMGELVHRIHPLRWMVPAFLGFLPSFVDLMSAVNNDAGAVAFFSLFLWGSVRILRRGVTAPWVFWVLVTAGLCYWTKDIVVIAPAMLPIVLLFGVLRGRWRWLAWGMTITGMAVGLFAVFSWDGIAFWYGQTLHGAPRSLSSQAPLGSFVFQVESGQGGGRSRVVQLLPSEEVRRLQGKLVTLGAWVWASEPVRAESPVLLASGGKDAYSVQVDATTEPAFYAFSVSLDENAERIAISLAPPPAGAKSITIYYDGLVLAQGERPQHEAPHFDDTDGRQGTWGTEHFRNTLRNASAERSGTAIRRWTEPLTSLLRADPNLMLATLLDWQGTRWYWEATASYMPPTFWAKFGWGHVPLIWPETSYLVLEIATLLGIMGAAIALARSWRTIPWSSAFVMAIALLGMGGAALLRGADSLVNTIYIPSARYLFPAIVPAAALLNLGWWELGRRLGPSARTRRLAILAYWTVFIGLDIFALLSLLRYYGSPLSS